MNKKRLIIILGFIVAIIPFLGLPLKFKEFILVISGFLIAFLGFRISKRIKSGDQHDIFMDSNKTEENFVDPEAKYENQINKTKHLLDDQEENSQF